ncbi:unnamed protein product [Mycena citricolor]|uniref:Calcineurin-like phosphoesterase domain-containing protein n=1 Tax=Mycena citricolor TaxID=2018698 RepID=A0AAD2H6L8_9AGAR|nr:unnamed protein product [Mycena citricolor]
MRVAVTWLAVLVSDAAAAPLTSSFSAGLLGVLSSKPKLIFGAKKTFKGEDVDWGPQQDVNTSHAHSVVLDNERPDFVDLLTGENLSKENATKYLDQVWAPTVERSIPFASIHGNHDHSVNIAHEEEINYEIAQHGKTLSYTRSDVGPRPYGLANYWVPVYAKASDVKPAVVLWFFDSRSFVTGEAGPVLDAADYYWVDENTVPTYIEQQSALMERVVCASWEDAAMRLREFPVGESSSRLGVCPYPRAKRRPFGSSVRHLLISRSTALTLHRPSAGDHDDEPDPSAQGFLNNVYTGLDLPFWNAVVSHLNGGPQVRNGRAFELKLSGLVKKSPTVRSWNSYEDSTTNEHVILGPHYMPQYNDLTR